MYNCRPFLGAGPAPSYNSSAPPVILDTDLAGDWDDVLDVKSMLTLGRAGTINPLGIFVSTNNPDGPGAADAMRAFYQQAPMTIGVIKRNVPAPEGYGVHTAHLRGNYPNRGSDTAYPNGLTEFRKLLAARSSADVTIVATGYMSLLRDLLESPADAVSSLTGAQLFSQKVARVIVVAGYWPNSNTSAGSSYGHAAGAPEHNFASSPADASSFIANCPAPLEFFGVEMGDNTGLAATTLAANRPAYDVVRAAQREYNAYNGLATGAGRPPWGALAFAYLVSPEKFSTVTGTGSVNATTGANSFTPGAGPHKYVVQVASNSSVISQVDGYLLDRLRADQ